MARACGFLVCMRVCMFYTGVLLYFGHGLGSFESFFRGVG